MVANPVRGHKEVPRSTGHIMVTTRYSDQQGSKSRQKVTRLYKRWHRPISKRFIKPPLLHIESSLDRLGLLSPTHDQRSQQQIGQIRSNQLCENSTNQSFDQSIKSTLLFRLLSILLAFLSAYLGINSMWKNIT